MKVLFLSFVFGLAVGVLYGLIRVKSPAPPIVALLGLLGMVLGEQLGVWILAKKVNVTRAAAVTDKHWGSQASAPPVLEAHPPAD